ncbi:MAG: 3-deoxy-D-manno-octulosonic acid transferase [Candidatus Omnitrophica bacterium]|nr:3-deoxy-D-manno-octulosonic acid transferase [Candidatus Omnitrophota bacterium]
MLIYDFLFIILFLSALPFLCLRRKLHRGYWQRLGFIRESRRFENSIWIHAVSVGEIISAKELIKSLKQEFPQRSLLISTITPTGNKIARTIATSNDAVIYLPLDISFIIRRFIKIFDPSIFISLESEFWPNLYIQLSHANIPKVILNGRISASAFNKYHIFKLFIKPILRRVDFFTMQTKEYQDRLMQLGVGEEKIEISGNMKFDVQSLRGQSPDIEKIRADLRLNPADVLFVCGCTHKDEEEIVLSVYKKLAKSFENLRLFIAPRHVERVKEIEKIVSNLDFRPVRISQLKDEKITATSVYLLDIIGRLKDYYAASSICFVGGSLVASGGHNILEPAAFSKPIIFGKYMYNFSDIRDLFLKAEAAIEVENESELYLALSQLLKNSHKAKNLGLNAKMIVDNNKGATARNVRIIKRFLKN